MDDIRTGVKALIVAAGIALALGLVWLCAPAPKSAAEEAEPATDATPKVPGQYLDAYTLDAPTWLDGCERCLLVVDRNHKQRWWLLEIDGQWVSMPITEWDEGAMM